MNPHGNMSATSPVVKNVAVTIDDRQSERESERSELDHKLLC